MTVKEIRRLFSTVQPGVAYAIPGWKRYVWLAQRQSIDDEMIQVAREIDEEKALAHIRKLRHAILTEVKETLGRECDHRSAEVIGDQLCLCTWGCGEVFKVTA